METIYKELLQYLGSEVAISLGVVILLIYLLNNLAGIQRTWADRRLGVQKLQAEKLRLESLKLKYEIEVIKKNHQLPDVENIAHENEETVDEDRVSGAPIEEDLGQVKEIFEEEDIPEWEWVKRLHHRNTSMSRGLLGSIYVLLWVGSGLFILLALVSPYVYWTDEAFRIQMENFWSFLFVMIFYIVVASVLTTWRISFSRQVDHLKAD